MSHTTFIIFALGTFAYWANGAPANGGQGELAPGWNSEEADLQDPLNPYDIGGFQKRGNPFNPFDLVGEYKKRGNPFNPFDLVGDYKKRGNPFNPFDLVGDSGKRGNPFNPFDLVGDSGKRGNGRA